MHVIFIYNLFKLCNFTMTIERRDIQNFYINIKLKELVNIITLFIEIGAFDLLPIVLYTHT